jgi:hypothetical protein
VVPLPKKPADAHGYHDGCGTKDRGARGDRGSPPRVEHGQRGRTSGDGAPAVVPPARAGDRGLQGTEYGAVAAEPAGDAGRVRADGAGAASEAAAAAEAPDKVVDSAARRAEQKAAADVVDVPMTVVRDPIVRDTHTSPCVSDTGRLAAAAPAGKTGTESIEIDTDGINRGRELQVYRALGHTTQFLSLLIFYLYLTIYFI